MAYWAQAEGGLPLLSSLTVRLSLYLSLSHLFEAADSSLVSRMKVNTALYLSSGYFVDSLKDCPS
jgi:hypothetical protein